MKDSATKTNFDSSPLGELSVFETEDGSYSLKSSHFQEAFHSSIGAITEAKKKFLFPSQIERFEARKQIKVLDVCLGLGYNSACLIEALISTSIGLEWWGLEIDRRPLKLALNSQKFKSIWSSSVLEILESILKSNAWERENSKGTMLWGDARQKIKLIPEDLTFDLILFDAFSPSHCPELWSEEFLNYIANKLMPGGRLMTYCRAAAVRKSLMRAGLQLSSLIPEPKSEKDWSAGTLAIRPSTNWNIPLKGPNWKPLSIKEEEHLLTRAAIPYRDPSGKDTSKQILARRQKEQEQCKLESTNDWFRRWGGEQSN